MSSIDLEGRGQPRDPFFVPFYTLHCCKFHSNQQVNSLQCSPGQDLCWQPTVASLIPTLTHKSGPFSAFSALCGTQTTNERSSGFQNVSSVTRLQRPDVLRNPWLAWHIIKHAAPGGCCSLCHTCFLIIHVKQEEKGVNTVNLHPQRRLCHLAPPLLHLTPLAPPRGK